MAKQCFLSFSVYWCTFLEFEQQKHQNSHDDLPHWDSTIDIITADSVVTKGPIYVQFFWPSNFDLLNLLQDLGDFTFFWLCFSGIKWICKNDVDFPKSLDTLSYVVRIEDLSGTDFCFSPLVICEGCIDRHHLPDLTDAKGEVILLAQLPDNCW